ncbi:MAG: glycoside hydrolase family 13 protein [Paludibacter sp.]|nr:glycoside hydrolase family 13 protein [Paludibacter sp.]
MKQYRLLIFMLLAFISVSGYAKKQQRWIDRLEPTSWWTSMHNPELQLMIHGNNISDADFKINYPGVSIIKKQLTDNPNFVFLYLNIAPETAPGKFKIEAFRAHKSQTYYYELQQRHTGSAERKSFTEADAIYLLMPDRFANGDTKNDSVKEYFQGVHRNIPSCRHGGDIAGIISKIPYMADLGITALWTTPVLENNDTAYSYHHYGCSDYYKVDPRFGSNEDYRRLSDSCHVHGLKLILDVVPNHCSGAHWWTKDKPAKDWFNEWPEYTSSNYRMNVWTDPYASESDLYKMTHGWFAPNMPDFNLNNPLVFDYLKQDYIYWIEYAGIDGLRVDTYPYNDIHVVARFLKSIRNEYPNMNIVGECWIKTPAEIAYYQSGNPNKDGFDSKLQSVMDFCLCDAFDNAFNEKNGWDNGIARFYNLFAQDFVYHNPNMIMNFLDNHDMNRYSTEVKRDTAKFKMGLALLTTVRGYPQIYYGTEIMLDGIQGDYQGHRFDFPGGWSDDKRNAFTKAGRTVEENAIFNYTKALLNYRKNNPVLQNGKMKQFISENGIYVFFRYNNKKTIMVITNNNENNYDLKTDRFAEMLKNKSTGTDIISHKTYKLSAPIQLKPKTVTIFEIK